MSKLLPFLGLFAVLGSKKLDETSLRFFLISVPKWALYSVALRVPSSQVDERLILLRLLLASIYF